MRRVAALVAILLLAVLAIEGVAVAGTPGTAEAAAAPAVPARDQPAPAPVRLDLSTMTPRVVTGAGPPELVLTGSITNTGTAPVDNLGVRAQRGAPLASEAEMRSALEGDAAVDAVTPGFADLGTLAPGQTLPFRYSVPLTGDPGQTLGLEGPGTYPLLVNVNGSAGGERSRLTSVRMLLPVSGLPGTPPADPPVASPFSLLYPITDAPRRIPPVPGEEPVLTDDELATSFAPGGRLRGLVDALAQQAPTGSPVRTSVCLAIDPELVATAAAMRGGYQVAAPGGPLTPGRGAEAADQWLTALSATARGSCVLALPSSDADLVSLVRGGQADLARAAVDQGRESLARDLGVPVLSGTVWPSGGVLDEPTLDALPGASSLLLSAEGLSGTDTARTSGVVPVNGPRGPVRAVVTDPLLTQAAGGPPDLGATPPSTPEMLSGAAGPMSTQDLVGTIAYRVADAPGEGPVVVAPPHRWTADGASAAGMLSAVAALIGDGRLAPTGLPAITTTGPVSDGPSGGRLYYPVQAGGAEVPASAVAVVADQMRAIAELQSAAEARTGVGARPEEVFGSLRMGLLRAVSGAWRGNPAEADRNAALVADRIARLRATVRVLEPPSPYSLGTSDAPLLITVANGLPVTMNVRVVLSTTSGLRIAPIPEQTVPPLGRIQVRVSAKVTRAGQFSVDAGLRTPEGAMLGPDTRLRVRSTVYGTVTVWLTAVAGAVLVVLVVRRILRRLRPGGDPPVSAGPPDRTAPVPAPSRPGTRRPRGGPTRGRRPSPPGWPTRPVPHDPARHSPVRRHPVGPVRYRPVRRRRRPPRVRTGEPRRPRAARPVRRAGGRDAAHRSARRCPRTGRRVHM